MSVALHTRGGRAWPFVRSWLLVACTAGGLAGCGGGGGGNAAAPEAAAESAAPAAAESEASTAERAAVDPLVMGATAADAIAAAVCTTAPELAASAAGSNSMIATAMASATANDNGLYVPRPPAGTGSNPVGALRWSDPATWGGAVPADDAVVVVPAGKTILLDVDTARLAGLRIEGTLRFDRKDLQLRTGYAEVKGRLEIGSEDQPFQQKATITLHGAPAAVNDGVARGLMVNGGTLALYGASPSPVWTKLNDHAAAGATQLTLKDQASRWRAGDTVVIAPTDYYGQSATERIELASAAGTRITLAAPLAKARWGKLQYATSTGLSLTPEAGFTPPSATGRSVLDERAAVGNLSRRIVVEGVDDDAWRRDGFGAHLMIMSLRSQVWIDGVEFRRVGQAGVTGRYPIHWHMLSYDAAGQLLGDATGHVVRNSAVWNSSNRCIVVHGTNGVQVLDNICQDIKGHAFFLEDAVERRNVFDGNLALTTRVPPKGKVLQNHEYQASLGGPSGFWLTNPDNIVTRNHAADVQGNGFWLAYPRKALGLSHAVALIPDRLAHAKFEDNTAHTATGPGVQLFTAPIDAAGNVSANAYSPTQDGKETNGRNEVRFTLKRVTSFKNGEGAYRNVAWRPDYVEWVTADNYGKHFAGSVQQGTITGGLAVGFSLNNATPYPTRWDNQKPTAFATYHSQMTVKDNLVINFPFYEGKTSGAFGTDDYYLRGVEMGTARNTGNRLIDSAPGFHTLPPNLDGQPLARRHWTYSGAFFDPIGYWGPAGNFAVIDVPFNTAGANCVWVPPVGKNGKSCDGQYYGVGSFETDFDPHPLDFHAPIEVIRQDAQGAEVGRWTVGDGDTGIMFRGARHFAAHTGGRYVLTFPGRPLAKSFMGDVDNAWRAGDHFLLAVQFDGSVTGTGYYVVGSRYQRASVRTAPAGHRILRYTKWLQPANSLAEVAASQGDRMWQDRANNLLWVKIQGGAAFPGEESLVPNSDLALMRTGSLVLYAK